MGVKCSYISCIKITTIEEFLEKMIHLPQQQNQDEHTIEKNNSILNESLNIFHEEKKSSIKKSIKNFFIIKKIIKERIYSQISQIIIIENLELSNSYIQSSLFEVLISFFYNFFLLSKDYKKSKTFTSWI